MIWWCIFITSLGFPFIYFSVCVSVQLSSALRRGREGGRARGHYKNKRLLQVMHEWRWVFVKSRFAIDICKSLSIFSLPEPTLLAFLWTPFLSQASAYFLSYSKNKNTYSPRYLFVYNILDPPKSIMLFFLYFLPFSKTYFPDPSSFSAWQCPK